ncbi:hypothetical protein GCM10023195_73920 [Actinoallomurus liliacearum]|uniref:Uncharacterized protein n=1 Tax=Actinoallomurus liliacearum TaxID=1080073 RepID=A0ABP8TZ68_9ACTN
MVEDQEFGDPPMSDHVGGDADSGSGHPCILRRWSCSGVAALQPVVERGLPPWLLNRTPESRAPAADPWREWQARSTSSAGPPAIAIETGTDSYRLAHTRAGNSRFRLTKEEGELSAAGASMVSGRGQSAVHRDRHLTEVRS